LYPLFLRGVLLPDAKFFTDAEMKPVWERILNEVSPDGSVSPYGASVGWNDTAGLRVAMLEILAARTNDGRYRYVAHRLMNYLVYQRLNYRTNHILMGPQSTEPLAIAYLLANDDLAPVSPDDSSMVLTRKETLRLPGYGVGQNDKKIAADVLGPLPEDDLRGFVSDGLLVTDSVKPSKLVLRSGWNPGDFYVLIDLFPRHDPLNPLGIVGMTRWGAALTCTSPAKGESAENRLIATAGPPTPTPKAPAIQPETTVEAFADSPGVTYASVSVSDYGLPGVSCDRRFLFVKNRFLMTRDDLASEGTVALTAATIFNTQNIEHEAGSNAYRTFMSQPYALGVGMLNPAVDLLVFQCPQPGASDRLRDRAQEDPRTLGVRAQLRHQWTGRLEKDASRHFATLFWPRPPAGPSGPVSMDPQVAVDQMNGRPPRDDIEVILDDDAATMLRTVDEEGVETWLVLNPGGREVEAGGLRTDAEAAWERSADPAAAEHLAESGSPMSGATDAAGPSAPGSVAIGAGGGTGGVATSTFFGARGSGRRFAFIVDKSGSMAGRGQGRPSKMDMAVAELLRSVVSLPDFAQFRICLFDTSANVYPERGYAKARAGETERLAGWIGGTPPFGGTMPKVAFDRIMGEGQPPDAIFFLTDGRIPEEDPDWISQRVVVRGRTVPVHCVAFGDRDAATQLEAISRATGGQFRFVPISGVSP